MSAPTLPGPVTAKAATVATARLDALFDPGTGTPLGLPGDGVAAAVGEIHGGRAVAFATDPGLRGGALGAGGCRRIVEAVDRAVHDSVPVIGLWQSGGARVDEGVLSLDAIGAVFAAMVRASGRVPQISVVLGPAAGGGAYGPGLTDIVVMSAEGRVFVTGPQVIRDVTGEDVDMLSLGGPALHGRHSGVAHVLADDEPAALDAARRIAALLGRQGRCRPPVTSDDRDPGAILPARSNRAYDVRPLVDRLLDDPGMELQSRWAPNVVTTLGRLGGGTVGVVANNPLRLGGCLDALAADKAARFVRMCDAFGVPLVVVVDVPGYLPGVKQEWDGVVRRGAKLLHAFADAAVPRVTLVTRKAYGGAYIAMNSRSLGATAVFAWPDAEIAVMGAAAAVNVLHRKRLAACPPQRREELRAELIADQQRSSGGVRRAVEHGFVDEIIDPATTRDRIAAALATAPRRRGVHRNIPL